MFMREDKQIVVIEEKQDVYKKKTIYDVSKVVGGDSYYIL